MDMHQEFEINCAIRRITNKKVWYLHSFDIEYNRADWTSNYHKAHQFQSEDDAKEFMRIFLGDERIKECDTFSEWETWSL